MGADGADLAARAAAHRRAQHGGGAAAREDGAVPRPFGEGAVAVMAGDGLARHRPALRRRAGLRGLGRAALVVSHAARRLAEQPAPARPKGRRGPKPAVSDADLLAAIRANLARSPWSGEGHRKAWARRAACRTASRVARKRVLRLMREGGLLSPHRARPRPAETHDRKIVTDAPNVMWAIDGTQVSTVQDGKVLAVRHGRALERRGARLARQQTRHAPRGPPGDGHGRAPAVRPSRPRRRPRRAAPPRSRQLLHGRGLPGPGEGVGHDPRAAPSSASPRPTASSSASSEPSKSRSSTAASSRPSTRSATPCAPSSPATAPSG